MSPLARELFAIGLAGVQPLPEVNPFANVESRCPHCQRMAADCHMHPCQARGGVVATTCDCGRPIGHCLAEPCVKRVWMENHTAD